MCLFLLTFLLFCRLDCHLYTDGFHVRISSFVRIHSPLGGPVETVSSISLHLSFPPPRSEFLPFNLTVFVNATNFIPFTQVPFIYVGSFSSSHRASSLFLKYAKYCPTSGPLYFCSSPGKGFPYMICKACSAPSFWSLQMLKVKCGLTHPHRGNNSPAFLSLTSFLGFDFSPQYLQI